jgi:pilus assembly protein CpaE
MRADLQASEGEVGLGRVAAAAGQDGRTPPEAHIEFETPLLPRKRPGPGRVCTVVAGKGGSGKSAVAANLAGAAARDAGLTTAVLDLSLQFGDQALMFDAPPSPSMVDVLANVDALTADFVLECMHQGPAGLRVLAAPPSPELADLVETDHVQLILGLMRTVFDFIVIDTASHLSDVTLEAVDSADVIVLLTTPHLASVKDTKLLLKTMSVLGVPASKLIAVLNRVEPNVRMGLEVLEANLKFPITHDLPHASQALMESVTDGVPLTISKPGSDFARAVSGLATIVITPPGDQAAKPQKKSFLGISR